MLRKAIKKGNEMKKIKATIFWGAVIILLLGIGVTVAHFKFGFLKKDETTEFVIQKIESQAKLKVTKTTSKELTPELRVRALLVPLVVERVGRRPQHHHRLARFHVVDEVLHVRVRQLAEPELVHRDNLILV